MQSHVIVVGGGIGGLASSCYLAKAGYKVTLLEKNALVGGRCNVFTDSGFRFDMGPSWYLMPDVFEKFFQDMGRNLSDHLQLTQLTPSYRVFFEDGAHVDMTTKIQEVAELFESWEPGAGEKFYAFLESSKFAYDVSMQEFLYKNYDSPLDFLGKRIVIDGSKLHVFESMQHFITRYFQDTRIQQILQYTLVFLGGAPHNTPAIYHIMTYIDFALGVWYPKGGLYAVPQSMENIAKELGVDIMVNTPVSGFLVNDTTKNISGVELADGSVITCDAVVANADYQHVQTALVPKKYQDFSEKYWEKRVMAPSAFILYLGVSRKVPSLQHHTLFFAEDWQKHFQEIFDAPAWPENPSLYIGCPSKTDNTVAPEGMENMFVLVPIASGLEDTPSLREEYTKKVFDSIERYTGDDIRKDVVVQHSFCLRDFEERYNSYKGSALGLAHTLMQTALFRPSNKAKKIRNLVYAGAGTTPGIGVPICLISGQLAFERIKKILPHNASIS